MSSPGRPKKQHSSVKRLVVRLPALMHDALQRRAEEHFCSMNTEVLRALEAWLRIDGDAREKTPPSGIESL